MHVADTLDLMYFNRSLKPAAVSTVKPVIRILDPVAAKAFYCGWLGFTIDWEYRFGESFPIYMQVSLGGLALHLTEHTDDCQPGGKVHIDDFAELRVFHRKLEATSAFGKPEIGPAYWDEGITMMEVVDPFGNKLVFTESVAF